MAESAAASALSSTASSSTAASSTRSVALAFHPSCSFSTSYQRNNKSNGQKNLRCFPGHCFEGHRSGWCGHPLVVRSRGGTPGLRLVGAFSPRADEGDSSAPQPRPKFILGQVVSSQSLDEALRASLLAECMEAFVEEVPRECDVVRESWESQNRKAAPPEGCDREFVFNSKSKGWHYGFLGSKKDSNVWHVWSVFALDPIISPENGQENYKVVARLDSPAFQLFCRRRNRGPLAKARLETSQRVSAVTCKSIYADSTPEEIASAIPSVPPLESAVFKKTPRKRQSIDTTAASSTSSSASSGGGFNSVTPKNMKKLRSSHFDDGSEHMDRTSSAIDAIVQAADQASEPDRRFEILLDLVHRVQLPGTTPASSSGPAGALAAQARRASHSALVLVPGQDASDFGFQVLKFAKHWRRMEQRRVPLPLQQSQQMALAASPEDPSTAFAGLFLGQADLAEMCMTLALWEPKENPMEPPYVQALRAADRMLHLMQRHVIIMQRLRTDMRMIPTPNPPTWGSSIGAPPSPIPSGGTPFSGMGFHQPDMLPSSPLLSMPGIGIPPFYLNQIHRRRMGSNTSTGSDPSVMMTDFDLEWFSKGIDGINTGDASNAHTL